MLPKLRCLVVGIADAVFPEGSIRADEAVSISFGQLRSHVALAPALELVVAPLFCDDFDALEIIEVLGSAGFRGVLRISAPKLPNRQIVLRELRGHAVRQGITLELVEET